jgi:hypothetical protein
MTTRETIDIPVPGPVDTGDVASIGEESSDIQELSTEDYGDTSAESVGNVSDDTSLPGLTYTDTPPATRDSEGTSEVSLVQQERIALQRQVAEFEARESASQREAVLRQYSDELQQYRSGLEDRGFDSSEIESHVASKQELQAELLAVRDDRANLQRRGQMVEANAQAKMIIAKEIATKYKVSVESIMDSPTPELMEKNAVIYSLQARLGISQRSKPTATTTDNSRPSAQAGGSRNAQLDRLMQKQKNGVLSDSDFDLWRRLNARQ